ncbi:TPA: hypothetical protein ACH3X2_007086 [Trebouxia sp. C0005]
MSLEGPSLSALDNQDSTWCLVGPAGRHKHWQPAKGSAAASVNNKFGFSLASLPGPAIASIFQHLDIYSSYQLAQTCRACAREAAHYRTHCKSDYCTKILPKVQSLAGTGYSGFPYGEITCVWTGSSCDALPYIHAMSQQPDFLASMWKAAWSAVPHSFCADIRSFWGDAMSGDFGYGNKGDCLTIHLFIHSTIPLHVSLAWLQAVCRTAKATLIQKFLDEGAGYVDNVMDITCWVYRPQGQLQQDECDGVETPQGGSWKYLCQHPPPNQDYYSRYEPVASKPEDIVTVTGSWCEFEVQSFTCKHFVCEADPKPEFDRYHTKKVKKPKTGGRRGWQLSERKQSRNAKRQSLQTFAE